MQELSSSTSSVQSWIDLVPTPRKRKTRNDENVADQARRKRYRAPLQDVSNIAAHRAVKSRERMPASSSKRGRAGRGAGGPKTPRRSGRKTPTEQPIPPHQEDLEEEGFDADPTPRGPSLLLAATQDTLGRSTLWQYPREMATNTKIGGFQVVRALQVVLDWAEKQYRPWFEREALSLTAEQRRRYDLS